MQSAGYPSRGESIAIAIGCSIYIVIATAFITRQQHMEIALITFAAGDLTTDILFVKQIRDRMVYCFDIINKYPDKNTSAFQKEADK